MRDISSLRRAALAAVLGLSALAIAACGAPKPEDVAINYYTAFAAGDFDAAVEQIYFPSKVLGDKDANDICQGKIRQAVDQAKANAESKGGLKSIKVTEAKQIEPDEHGFPRYSVTVEIAANDNSTDTESTVLINADGTWKVDMMSAPPEVDLGEP